jgi:hypothetical protein
MLLYDISNIGELLLYYRNIWAAWTLKQGLSCSFWGRSGVWNAVLGAVKSLGLNGIYFCLVLLFSDSHESVVL